MKSSWSLLLITDKIHGRQNYYYKKAIEGQTFYIDPLKPDYRLLYQLLVSWFCYWYESIFMCDVERAAYYHHHFKPGNY